jgi:hypothetical protein
MGRVVVQSSIMMRSRIMILSLCSSMISRQMLGVYPEGKTAFHFSGSCSNGSMSRRFQPLGLRGQMTGNLLVQPTLNLGRNVDDFDGH